MPIRLWTGHSLSCISSDFLSKSADTGKMPDYQGYISYGKAIKTGSYLSVVTAFVYAVYTSFIYSAHPETLKNYLTTVESVFKELYPNSPLADNMTQMLHAFTTPLTMGFSEFISKTLLGVIYSLIVAAFLKKSRPTEI